MKFIFFLIPLILPLAACSTNVANPLLSRSIANDNDLPVNIDELFTIKSSSLFNPDEDYVSKNMANLSYYKLQVQFILDEKMPSNEAYKIVPDMDGRILKLKIFHSKEARMDQDATLELTSVVQKMAKGKFTGPYSMFELYYNVKEQNFTSIHAMAKLRLEALMAPPPLWDLHYPARALEYTAPWKEALHKLNEKERHLRKEIQAKKSARKSIMDALDNASSDEQFRSLVARNDRQGAADVLRKYLPWEDMPPFEKRFWEDHLAIMANPLPYEKRVLIYRGHDDDAIQVAEEAGKILKSAEAIKEQKVFFMSTLLTKNQGSWNRRLRSLISMYEKYIATDESGSSEFTKAARISTMFSRHAADPKGSPFLSYTPSESVAENFGNKRMGAYLIDPRLLHYNYTSLYTYEFEFLLPLISFPDELAALWDQEIHGALKKDFLTEKLQEKLVRELGSTNAQATYLAIKSNSSRFFHDVLQSETTMTMNHNKIETNFFKKTTGLPKTKVVKEFSEKSDLSCINLLQLFWK